MKKILGLDLGTSSIGWAVVNQAENDNEKSNIVKLGVRVNPLTVDEKGNFEKGKSITTTAERTIKRGMRRNLQRYKQRRNNLVTVLRDNNIIGSHNKCNPTLQGIEIHNVSEKNLFISLIKSSDFLPA